MSTKAIHVNWTLPNVPYLGRCRRGEQYCIEDFELLTTILSARTWRRFNGPIKLYTDDVGEQYYERLGMLDLWDGGVDTRVLKKLDPSINHDVFWTAGRTLALSEEKAPFFSLDTDLVVWGEVSSLITSEFMSFHPECLTSAVYKAKHELCTPLGYIWDEWDWSTIPCNAGLMYFGNSYLPQFFSEKAMAFMSGNLITKESVDRLPVHDVFVAQRLLPMCARRIHQKTTFFLNWSRPVVNSEILANGCENRLFTHVWAHKHVLKNDPHKRRVFCTKCVNRILSDYPDCADILFSNPAIRPYC